MYSSRYGKTAEVLVIFNLLLNLTEIECGPVGSGRLSIHDSEIALTFILSESLQMEKPTFEFVPRHSRKSYLGYPVWISIAALIS